MNRRADKPPTPPGLRLRLVFEGGGMIGPGKADLMEAIRETGSIAAAGRRLGMSYKRAWMLVETLNAMFETPLVESSRGGASQGGARLTEAGERVVGLYRAMVAKAAAAGAGEIGALRAMTRLPAGGEGEERAPPDLSGEK